MYADRWSVVSWPAEYGGRGVGILEWLVFEEEYWRAQAPLRVSQNGVFLLAPTMFEFGTDEQKERFLPPMASATEIWCQGWSEPDAGSDLAGIRSRAVRSGADDGWVLTGQKTWASRGAFAEWCFGLFRTDPEAERHRGLTYFLVDMATPGVTVRPIPQLDGETGFAEIFFEDVFVPDSLVLGQVGQGWNVAMATAGSERGLSLRSPARYSEAAGRLVALWSARRETDPAGAARTGDAVVQAWMDAEAYRLNTLWTATRVVHGGSVGPEASANKIHWSETDLAIHRTGPGPARSRGRSSTATQPDAPWLDGYLLRPGRTDLCRHQRDPTQRGGRAPARAAAGLSGRRPTMHFAFTPADSSATRCASSWPTSAPTDDVRAAFETPAARSPRWTVLAELGVVGLSVPAEHGGLGLGLVDLVLLLEESGRVALPEPSWSPTALTAPLWAEFTTGTAAVGPTAPPSPVPTPVSSWLEGIAKGTVAAAGGRPSLRAGTGPVAGATGADLLVLAAPAPTWPGAPRGRPGPGGRSPLCPRSIPPVGWASPSGRPRPTPAWPRGRRPPSRPPPAATPTGRRWPPPRSCSG